MKGTAPKSPPIWGTRFHSVTLTAASSARGTPSARPVIRFTTPASTATLTEPAT